jgi:hypothetical protein
MVLTLGPVRPATLLGGVLAALLAFQGVTREGLWYVERAWGVLLGGWFVALTLRWPGTGFTPRALGAVAGSVGAAALLLSVTSGGWETLDWTLGARIRSEIAAGVVLLERTERGMPEGLADGLYRVAEIQALLFPASLALASMAALGVAWWLHVALARGSRAGIGPLKDFDFNDHLVWLLVVGLSLVVMGNGQADRLGWNAVVFMGGLYALRGAAVMVFLSGGISFLWGVLFALVLAFVWPIAVVSAAAIGLGDTWLRVRDRARRLAGG